MVKVAILTDDTCDLPVELIEKLGIIIIPVKIIFSDQVYLSSGPTGELDLNEYYEKTVSEIPTTSTPSPGIIFQKFEKALQKADTAIGIFISNLMSPIATNSQALIKQKFPDKKIHIFDSKVTSVALAILVLEAAIMAQNDQSFEEIIEKTTEFMKEVNFAGIMSTMENLVRTGRVPRTKKFLADFFSVKPVVKMIEGKVTVQGKIKANDKVIIQQMKKFGRLALENINGFSNHVLIGHTRWPEAAEEIATYIKQHNPKNKKIIIQETGAIVANFVGKKTLTIGYLGKYENSWLENTKN
ncbi:MAG: DegV family protein [Candidatus Heimdallarchaeota archaeon]